MEILIVEPKNSEQLAAIKAFLKALKVNFKASPQQLTKFDFSDIAGQLEWKGNAVEEQKKLRAEWD
jgi:hypothetical protein